MTWKEIRKIKIVNQDGEVENINFSTDGNFYKIENDFGNVSFVFDAASGYDLAEVVLNEIKSDIENEINAFLNSKDFNGIENDTKKKFKKKSQPKQMKMFSNTGNISFKNNKDITTKTRS